MRHALISARHGKIWQDSQTVHLAHRRASTAQNLGSRVGTRERDGNLPILSSQMLSEYVWMSREVTQWKKNEKMTFLIHYTRICFKHWDVMMLPLENWTEHVKFAACDNEALTWSGRAWTRHLATVSTHAGFASRWGLSLASSRWLEASSSPGEWVLKKMAISTAPKVPCRWFRPTNSIICYFAINSCYTI